MSAPIGTYTLHQSPLDRESGVLISFDFSSRHEIAAGATVVSAVVRLLLGNIVSSDISVGSPAIDVSGKLVQVRITDVSAVLANSYRLICDATFSQGTTDVESVRIDVMEA